MRASGEVDSTIHVGDSSSCKDRNRSPCSAASAPHDALGTPAVVSSPQATGTTTTSAVDLGTLGGTYSRANAVNDSGQVVGYASLADGTSHAFSWTAAGGMVDLGTLGGTSSSAAAANDSGQVVGTAYAADGDECRLSWTAAGGMVDLGDLGGGSSSASAVNDSGQVVGGASDASRGRFHAFSWTAAGGMVDLGTLGGGTYSARPRR